MCLLGQGGRGSVKRDSGSSWAALKSTGLQERFALLSLPWGCPFRSRWDMPQFTTAFSRGRQKSGMNDSRQVISSNAFSSTPPSLLQHFMPGQHKDPAEQRHLLCSNTGGNILVVQLKFSWRKCFLYNNVYFILPFLLEVNDRRKSSIPEQPSCCLNVMNLVRPEWWGMSMCYTGVGGRYHPQHWLLTHVFPLLWYQQSLSFIFRGSLIFRAQEEHVVATDTVVSTVWSFQYAAVYQKMYCKELTAKNTWKSFSRLLPAAIHPVSRGKTAVFLLWWLCEDKSLEISKWQCLDILGVSNLWVSDAKEKSACQLWDLDFNYFHLFQGSCTLLLQLPQRKARIVIK